MRKDGGVRKTAKYVLLLLALISALGGVALAPLGWAEGPAQTGEAKKDAAVAKKYPPYPDVWGYELPWPGKDDRDSSMSIYKMPDGDYAVLLC